MLLSAGPKSGQLPVRVEELARLKHDIQVIGSKCMTRITFHSRQRRDIRTLAKIKPALQCAHHPNE
jgi:hypothetical protein